MKESTRIFLAEVTSGCLELMNLGDCDPILPSTMLLKNGKRQVLAHGGSSKEFCIASFKKVISQLKPDMAILYLDATITPIQKGQEEILNTDKTSEALLLYTFDKQENHKYTIYFQEYEKVDGIFSKLKGIQLASTHPLDESFTEN
jgi:hypothetical protein